MTIISIRPKTPEAYVPLQITGNSVAGVGNVTIRETLGCWAKFSHWICCNTRNWQAFHTNLGIRHIDVQDDNLRARIQAVYMPVIQAPAALSLGLSRDTPLHHACNHYISVKESGDQEAIRDALDAVSNLIEHNADPFLENAEGMNAFDIADNDLALIKVLTRTDKKKAFDHCKDMHDFWDVIYPPCKDKLPEGWQEWIKILKGESLSSKISEISSEVRAPSFLEILQELEGAEKEQGKPLTAKEIKKYLINLNPIFQKAWQLFVDKPPKIRDVPPSYFAKKRIQEEGGEASYSFKSHKIFIESTGSIRQKLITLSFETMNALLRPHYLEISKIMESSETTMPREAYALLVEYIEWDGVQAFYLLFDYKDELDELLEWKEQWIDQNQPNANLTSHTQAYRMTWDNLFAWKYTSRHRAEFQARLKELL